MSSNFVAHLRTRKLLSWVIHFPNREMWAYCTERTPSKETQWTTMANFGAK